MKRGLLLQRAPRIITIVLLTVMFLVSATIGNATEKKPDDGWHFTITPYVWLPNIKGSMKLDQPPGFADGKLDVGPGDYLENLIFAGMLDL